MTQQNINTEAEQAFKNAHQSSIKKQKGFTAIELGVVLLAIGLLGGAALALSKSLGSDTRAQTLVQYVSKMASDVRKLGISGSYGTDTALNQVLIDNGKVPGAFQVSGTTITHTLDGNLVVTGKNRRFVITITGLAKENCTDIVASSANGYERLFVDTSATAPATVTTGGSTAPITPIQANTLCAQATGNSIHLVAK